MRRCLADDVVIRDHRVLGVGAETGDELVASARAMAEISPDAAVEILRILAWNRCGRIAIQRMFGSAMGGGGPLENFSITVTQTRGDRIQRLELFDIDAADAARARFAELCAERDPLRIPDNAASRTGDRILAAIASHDLALARELTCHDFVWEDRGKRALTSGGVELWFESIEYYQSLRGQRTRERIATRGDRIEINRVTWTGAPGGSEYEIEFIVLFEIDAEGKLLAAIRFDPDDRAAAFEEAEARFLSGEAANVGGQAPFLELDRALRGRDWEAMRRSFADGAVVRDHRTLGVGQETVDELIASMRAQSELSPDARVEGFRLLAWNRHGRVMVVGSAGSALDGGGPFENFYITVTLARGDRVDRQEVFDIDASDAALARFAELCAERE
jgi:ketosteroid isomerase-like protein